MLTEYCDVLYKVFDFGFDFGFDSDLVKEMKIPPKGGANEEK